MKVNNRDKLGETLQDVILWTFGEYGVSNVPNIDPVVRPAHFATPRDILKSLRRMKNRKTAGPTGVVIKGSLVLRGETLLSDLSPTSWVSMKIFAFSTDNKFHFWLFPSYKRQNCDRNGIPFPLLNKSIDYCGFFACRNEILFITNFFFRHKISIPSLRYDCVWIINYNHLDENLANIGSQLLRSVKL